MSSANRSLSSQRAWRRDARWVAKEPGLFSLQPEAQQLELQSALGELLRTVDGEIDIRRRRRGRPVAEIVAMDVERIAVDADLEAVQRLFKERHWTDGLPIIRPTEERVSAMLGAVPTGQEPFLGLVGSRVGEATPENLTVNPVMVGCRPAAFPVIVAAVQAMLHPRIRSPAFSQPHTW